MDSLFQERIIRAYSEGQEIESIAKDVNSEVEMVSQALHQFRNQSRKKRAFSDDFKRLLAERDLTGVPRTTIAKEMDINVSTVKKSCEQYGQDIKGVFSNDKTYTKIDGVFPTDRCVECESTRYNQVYDNTYYCRGCGNEYIHKKDHVLRVNWEYID